MVYSERPGPINSSPDFPRPDVNITFDSGDRIVGALGRTWAESGYYVVSQLGFQMASGKQYGPYGQEYGTPFYHDGSVFSIFGREVSNVGVSAIGFWTTPVSSPPPAPPSKSAPVSPPPPPGRNALWNLGRIQTIPSGSTGDLVFDDGGTYSGTHVELCRECRIPCRSEWRERVFFLRPRPRIDLLGKYDGDVCATAMEHALHLHFRCYVCSVSSTNGFPMPPRPAAVASVSGLLKFFITRIISVHLSAFKAQRPSSPWFFRASLFCVVNIHHVCFGSDSGLPFGAAERCFSAVAGTTSFPRTTLTVCGSTQWRVVCIA